MEKVIPVKIYLPC